MKYDNKLKIEYFGNKIPKTEILINIIIINFITYGLSSKIIKSEFCFLFNKNVKNILINP